jgi:cation diffusion facilitator CzcD-associated flavoprotein CzcO
VHTTVAIIGSGFSGLAMAARLSRDGVDCLILERADALGGTWRDNTYPGCACDIPSHLYSLSFALNPEWSSTYAGQAEIRAYMEKLADDHDLRPLIVFGADVRQATWNQDLWTLRCEDGRVFTAQFVVNAIGGLRDPLIPALPNAFEGPQMHSARWDASVDLKGKRVVVIGTGASAIQIVPAIAEQVAELHVVQRTPPWIVPRGDGPYGGLSRWAFRTIPGLCALWRFRSWLIHELRYPLFFGGARLRWLATRGLALGIRRLVHDPELRRQVTPDYNPGCKRILVADGWYEALQRPNVRLHTGSVRSLSGSAVELEDTALDADVVLWCTGFRIDDPLGQMQVTGRDGVDLRGWWGARPRAYLGMTIPNFPNAFAMLGPNTALGHSSVLLMIESQVRYIRQAVRFALEQDRPLEVREESLTGFLAEMDREHTDQVWMSGCRSWYLNEHGENYTIWPGSTLSYMLRTRRFDPSHYI